MADEDWLPENPPPDQKVGSAKRTFAIWFILVVMFVAIYSMFTTDPSSPPSPTSEPSGYSGYWIWGAGIVGFLLPVLLVVWQFGGATKFNQAQKQGLEALAHQKPLLAADLFAELARKVRAKPAHYAVASYNYGYALLRAGESAKAVGVLLRVERTPKLNAGNGIRTMTPIALARAFALGGDVTKANAWLEAAKVRPALDNPVYGRALLASVEALVRCREGKYSEALVVLEANWHVLEQYLSVDVMAEPWLLRAFATTMQSSVRDAAAAEPWIRALRIRSPEQSRWLTYHWPELAHLATTHDLLRAAPSQNVAVAPAPVTDAPVTGAPA
jgi:hypothetical protein